MSTPRPSPRGFTLVEMLVVLGIIGLLIALLLPALVAAVNNARRTALALEIKQLDDAFETYKQQKGEYPPSFGERNASGALVYDQPMGTPNRFSSIVERHLQRCYPKFLDRTPMNPADLTDPKDYFYNRIAMNTMTGNNIDQSEALVFWLRSVGTNAANPFDTASTRNSFFEFDERRLVDADGDGFPTYQAKNCRDTNYVYIESRTYHHHLTVAHAAAGVTQPYFQDNTGTTLATLRGVNTGKFQIISAGLDGDFGTPLNITIGSTNNRKLFVGGQNYTAGDRDNMTNFSGGKTLGDSRPQ